MFLAPHNLHGLVCKGKEKALHAKDFILTAWRIIKQIKGDLENYAAKYHDLLSFEGFDDIVKEFKQYILSRYSVAV